MTDFLLHLWAGPPARLPVACPAPPPGEPLPPPGEFDPSTILAAYSAAGWLSLVAVVLVVLVCYLFTTGSTSPRFTIRWFVFLGIAAVVAFAVPVVVLRVWPTRALANSCLTNPTAFTVTMPWDVVISRGLAGIVWGVLVFTLVSILLTRTAGRWPSAGGFFHHRGCPWPRFAPFGE